MAIDRSSYTPPPLLNSRPPNSCKSDSRISYDSCAPPSPFFDRSHVLHKVPAGDSPYVRAKRVQLIEKDPTRSVSLFWRAINSGDRVDSALKDMALVMKQLDRSDEAIEAIRSFRHLCSMDAQESLDNILIELYKRTGRMDEQVEILQGKLNRIEEEASTGGKRTKIARSQGKKVQITAEQEYSRLLGNLAWAHLQQNNFKVAEEYYRKGLSIELDRNKQCNLAICLIHMNRIQEAKLLLQSVKVAAGNLEMDESYAKSYERAHELLDQDMNGKENYSLQERDHDCQSQLDYIDKMCTVRDAKSSGSNLHTPVVSKWKSDNVEEVSAQRLYTQPIINRKQHRKTTRPATPCFRRGYTRSPLTQPKRNPGIFGCGPYNSNESKTEQQLSDDGVEKSCLSNIDPNTNCSDPANCDNVDEEAKEFLLPSSWSCKSGKSWADMVEEDEQEGLLDYTNDGAQIYSKNSSARRSLSFDHEEQPETMNFDTLPPKPKGLLTFKGNKDITS